MRTTAATRTLRLKVTRDWRGRALPRARQSLLDLSLANDTLDVRVEAPFAGDPPPPPPAGRLDGLWEFEVVELFLAMPRRPDSYLELELSPHGHHLLLVFDAPRRRRASQPDLTAFEATIDGAHWHGCASLDLKGAGLDFSDRRILANAFRLAGEPRRHELAWPLPGTTPDFHQPSAFPELDWREEPA